VVSDEIALREQSRTDELFEALAGLEREAAVQATESSVTSEWWDHAGSWLSAIVYSLSGATALLAFVALHDAGQVASITLGVTALFLALSLAATLGLRPGAAGEAATARQEASRRYMEIVRRFRRTEARLMEPAAAWQRFDALAEMLTAIKAGRLDAANIHPTGGS
jgi:hypothetical protein